MPILTVNNLTKEYSQHTVVDQISFTLTAGKCIALIGPNGAGKTTTLRMITRLIHPTSGSIHIHHEQVDDRTLIGYLPQHPVFYSWMTGLQYLVYSAQLTNIKRKVAIEKANQLLELVGLEDAKYKRIVTY